MNDREKKEMINQIPDQKFRKIAELVSEIAERTDTAIAFYVCERKGNKIIGFHAILDMDNDMLQSYAANILHNDRIMDSIASIEDVLPNKATTRRWQGYMTRFLNKVKEMME